MKVLVVIDEYGWAFEFFARGWKKYSQNEVSFRCSREISQVDINESDVVFFLTNIIFQDVYRRLHVPVEKAVCGVRSFLTEEQNFDCSKVLAIISNNEKAFFQLGEKYKSFGNLFYLPSAVDCEEWSYSDVSSLRKIGWSGNPNQPVKRVYLLDKIGENYGGVSRKSDWGSSFFHKNRERKDQLMWYRSIGCFVQVSSSEGLSQSLLEAVSCGVPVVATSVGDTSKIIEDEFLLPIEEEECVSEANRKINILFENKELRQQVALRNRERLKKKGWCWSVRAREYDSLMENLLCE